MSNRNNKKGGIPEWAKLGHSRPLTRREMLAAGIIPFSAKLLMPQYLGLLLGSKAHAESTERCPVPEQGWVPFITLNLAGGAGLMANFVPHDQGGQPLPSYSLMGLGKSPSLQYEFGGVPFAGNGVANILTGIKSKALMDTVNKTAFAGVCVSLKDDTKDNKLSVDGMLVHAGRVGGILPNLGIRADTPTGMGHQPALIVPPAPLIVKDFKTIKNSLGYTADLGTMMNENQQKALSKMIQGLSTEQMARLGANDAVTEVVRVVECAGMTNMNNMNNPSNTGIDPRDNMTVKNLWGITDTTKDDEEQLIFAAMTYNVLNGNAGAASLELGGYDYHNGTRTKGDKMDMDAGALIGKILETAATLQKPLFLYVTSDGSVASSDSDNPGAPWVWDRGSASTNYMFYYDPRGRRDLVKANDYSVGWFTKGQVADESFLTGNSAELSAVAVFANYLAVNNKLDQFGRLTNDKFSRDELAKVVKFMA